MVPRTDLILTHPGSLTAVRVRLARLRSCQNVRVSPMQASSIARCPVLGLASRRAGGQAAGHDGAYRSFEGISGAGSLALDRSVGLGDRRVRSGQPFRGPALELLT